MTCQRCAKDLTKDDKEFCWYCGGKLCSVCYGAFGHCGHSQADSITEGLKKVKEKDEKAG